MASFPFLDVVIGLCFVYLLLALVCSTLTEWIAQLRGSRGRFLHAGIRSLLSEELGPADLTAAVFAHPLVRGLKSDGAPPSYIPASTFAKVLGQEIASRGPAPGATLDAARPLSPALAKTFAALHGPAPVTVAGNALLAGGTPIPSESVLADWFSSGMERLSGTYKRRTRIVALLIAAGITILFNADTLALTNTLWHDASLRSYLVERAKSRLAEGGPIATPEYTEPDSAGVSAPATREAGASTSGDQLADEDIAVLGQLLGWKGGLRAFFARDLSAIAWSLIGWIVTALAVSLGAPFWFDTLNRFMNFRSSGPAPKDGRVGADA